MKGHPHTHEGFTILAQSSQEIRSRIDIGPGYLHRTADVLKQCAAGAKVLIATQGSIPEVWRLELAQTISDQGFAVEEIILPEGEECKSEETLLAVWNRLQEINAGRADSLIALGGGAVCDVAGFAASTYLRGIKLVLVPSTLLAQVDASIGGKTAINLQSGKNLAGSFYFPTAVIVDPELLKTLSPREFKSGLGEVVKYALIEDTVAAQTPYQRGPRPLLEVLERLAWLEDGNGLPDEDLCALIGCCVRMKLAVVIRDPYEQSLRRCLNLGHTLGHAIEKVSDYTVSHGEAVSIGCKFSFDLATRMGRMKQDGSARVASLLTKLGLPKDVPPLPRELLLQAMIHDKKRSGTKIKYVLPVDSPGLVSLDTELSAEEIAGSLG